MNEKNKITGEEAAKAIHQLNKSVKMSNILLDYLYAYQGGDPDPSIGNLFNGYKKLDLAAQGYGVCLNADIRHQVRAAWNYNCSIKKQAGMDVPAGDADSIFPEWMLIDFDIEDLAEQIRIQSKEIYRLKPEILHIAAKKGELKPGNIFQEAFPVDGAVWMYYVRWHNRAFHLFIPESKYGYYKEKYPDSRDHGREKWVTAAAYPPEEIQNALQTVKKYIEVNQELLKDYPTADIGDMLVRT